MLFRSLTQMTYGYSRDDAGRFLPLYVEQKVLPWDPFQSIDVEGIGQLVRLACERGRATRPDLHLGICGEHGGDPQSIDFFEEVGLDYVSCSPYRVPIARLAAAQAALARRRPAVPSKPSLATAVAAAGSALAEAVSSIAGAAKAV